MTQNNYARLLLDPRWQKRRLEKMAQDHWRCIACGAGNKTLHVHHICYINGRMPWEYADELLETLCLDCHDTRHVLPLLPPDLCILCQCLVTNENVGGRNGKREFICEKCIQKEAQNEAIY